MDRRKAMKAIWVGLLLAGLLVTAARARAETVTYLHTDLLGSVVLETDQNRNVVKRYEYEPYGLPRQAIADAAGYTGHVHDAGSGLVYMQQRYYDPGVGRFLSVDPVGVDTGNGGNFNRYWYGNNNPYRYIDPDGRVPVLVAAAVFAWRAYSAYDTVTSAAENISTLADADASLGDKTMAGLELAASVLGGKAGRESLGAVTKRPDARADRTSATNRSEQRAKGIPDSQLGPSGRPKRHNVTHGSRKEAREAAERDAPRGGGVRHDANPADPRQGSHFQAEDAKGDNARPVVHHEYPKRKR